MAFHISLEDLVPDYGIENILNFNEVDQKRVKHNSSADTLLDDSLFIVENHLKKNFKKTRITAIGRREICFSDLENQDVIDSSDFGFDDFDFSFQNSDHGNKDKEFCADVHNEDLCAEYFLNEIENSHTRNKITNAHTCVFDKGCQLHKKDGVIAKTFFIEKNGNIHRKTIFTPRERNVFSKRRELVKIKIREARQASFAERFS